MSPPTIRKCDLLFANITAGLRSFCIYLCSSAFLCGWFSIHAQPIPQSGTHLIPRQTTPYRPATKIPFSTPFRVGDTLTLPAYSFQLVGGGKYHTTTTCRYVGDHCYIFVEDDMWNTPRVTQAGIESLARAFDQSTARHPDRGIYETVTNLFGDPPDVDADPRILILVLDVLDSPITGITFIGYIDTDNEAPPVSREIIYIDARPLDIDSNLARATLAHEFQHLIHWKADPDEAKWLDEGCSEYAELACGYKDTTAAATENFLSLAANTDLTYWEDQFFDFDQTYLYMTYFAQRYGDSALRKLVADPDSSIASIDNILQSLNMPERFNHLFGQWAAAMYLDGEGDLGYRAIDLPPVKREILTVPTNNLTRRATRWGIDYLDLGETPDLAFTIQSTGDNDLLVTLIAEGNQPFAAPIPIPASQTKRIHTSGNIARSLAITSTSGTAIGYTLSVSELASGPATSDFDGDSEIGFSDFLAFVSGFGKTAGDVGFDPTFDLDGDLRVTFSDFLIFVQNFGADF